MQISPDTKLKHTEHLMGQMFLKILLKVVFQYKKTLILSYLFGTIIALFPDLYLEKYKYDANFAL